MIRAAGFAWPVWLVLWSLGFATPTLLANESASINLQPQFKTTDVGRTSRYEIWSRRTTQATMHFGRRETQAQRSIENEGEITWSIQRVKADGSAICSLTIDWLVLRITPPGPNAKPIVSDSRKGAGGGAGVHRMLKAITGKPLTVEVAADGRVTQVRGIDAMRQAAGREAPLPDERQFFEIAATTALLDSAPAMAQPGDTWTTQNTWSREGGQVLEKMTYTVGPIEQIESLPIVTIVGQAQLKYTPDRSRFPKDGPKVDIRQTVGELQTQIMVDLIRGETIGRNNVEHRVVEVTIHAPNNQKLKQIADETEQSQVLRIAE